MDFELSEDHLTVKNITNRFLAEHWDKNVRREKLDQLPASIPDSLWKKIADMGWLGVMVSEEHGGGGLDLMAAAVIAEAAGAALLPGPLISSLAAIYAISNNRNKGGVAELEEMMNGKQRIAIAIEEPGGSWGPTAMKLEANRNSKGGGTLSGSKILVADGDYADGFLVAARIDGVTALIGIEAGAPGLVVNSMNRLDGQSIVELQLDKVSFEAGTVLSDAEGSASLLEKTYDVWTTLLTADLLGVAQAVLDMTTDYAKERIQFGRPVGSFQAVSHRLADALVNIEIGRSLLYAACLFQNENRADAAVYVSAAKAWMNNIAVSVAETGLQLHGGIGYTWELDIQLYLRQARSNAVALGDASYHEHRIAAFLNNKFN